MAVPTVPERPAAPASAGSPVAPAEVPPVVPSYDRAARARAQGRLRWELLSQLVQKDLKTKYQGSTLGFVWSLANPLLQLAIYYVIFTYVFSNGVPDYHVYLMSGLLAFTAFSAAVSGASTSVVGNAGLVKKVRFPLLVLPLSAIGFALVQLALQLPVLFGIAAVSGVRFWGPPLVLLLPALALLVCFSTALGVLVSALNVRYRDTSHFVEIAMLVWFWANPVLYPAHLVRDRLGDLFWLYFLNPMATVVSTMQRAVYQQPYYTDASGQRQLLLIDAGYATYARNLLLGFAVSGVLLLVAAAVFRRLQADFAEEL